MLLVLTLLWGLVLAAPASAQTQNQNSTALQAWLAAQTNIHSWSAEFTQTRTFKALAQPLQTEGRVWFAEPSQFRWELGTPPQTIAVRNVAEMLVIYPNLRRAERYPLAGHPAGPWRDALALLEAGFPRSAAELESRFKILGQTETNGVVEVSLQPKSPHARRMMPQLKIAFGTADLTLRTTELQFADGSTLRNEFRNPRINPYADTALFQPSLEADFKVVEPLKKP